MSKTVNFSANQIKFIEWLATPDSERKPVNQKLLAQELNVREETLSRWKRDKELTREVISRARELVGEDLPAVYAALRREAKKGNFQHIKLTLELTGEYSDEHIVRVKVEKEIDTVLDALEQTLDDDTYNRVLAAISGGAAGADTPTEAEESEGEE